MYRKEIEAFIDGHKEEMIQDIFTLCRINSEKMPYEEGMPYGRGAARALSQALAMALRKEEYPYTADFQAEDERVIRYLKGETVALREEAFWPDGSWILVCTDGFPLGWAKRAGLNLKNKYYPGWRWQ